MSCITYFSYGLFEVTIFIVKTIFEMPRQTKRWVHFSILILWFQNTYCISVNYFPFLHHYWINLYPIFYQIILILTVIFLLLYSSFSNRWYFKSYPYFNHQISNKFKRQASRVRSHLNELLIAVKEADPPLYFSVSGKYHHIRTLTS